MAQVCLDALQEQELRAHIEITSSAQQPRGGWVIVGISLSRWFGVFSYGEIHQTALDRN